VAHTTFANISSTIKGQKTSTAQRSPDSSEYPFVRNEQKIAADSRIQMFIKALAVDAPPFLFGNLSGSMFTVSFT
jgi:hypothetical protein